MKYKVVFTTDRGDWHQQTAIAAAPENLAITMLRTPDKAALIEAIQDAEFLISERFGIINAEIIQSAPKLKLIQRLGSLVYDIDLDAASKAGIAVCYKPVGGVIRVAEHLVMQILAVSKKLREVEAIALAASPDWGESQPYGRGYLRLQLVRASGGRTNLAADDWHHRVRRDWGGIRPTHEGLELYCPLQQTLTTT